MFRIAECSGGAFEPPVVSGDAEREGRLELRSVVSTCGQNSSFVRGQWVPVGLGLLVLCSTATTSTQYQSKCHQPEPKSILHCLTSSSSNPTLHTPPEGEKRTSEVATWPEHRLSLGILRAQ